MNEHCYSELPLKAHGRMFTVPLVLAGLTLAGAALNVEPFESYLPWMLAAIGAGSAVHFAAHVFQAEQKIATLRVNATTLTFHTGGVATTLFWREIFGIEVGQVPEANTGFPLTRVKILARKAGTRHQDVEAIPLDQNYGKSPEALRDLLRLHWHEALDASRTSQANHAAQFGNAPRSFGRRASDRV